MSCFHGNHPDACDICDEVDAASKRGYEAGFKACLRENFTTPPQRTWVNLTDEDRNDCLVEADPCECLATPEAQELMRCVEAKSRSKNQ
jgi:hypothetical protein